MTHSLASPLLAALLAIVGACGPRAGSTTRPPPPIADVTPPAPDAAPSTALLRLGEWPNSTPHQWGWRNLEFRGEGPQTELRLHDVTSFQGVGMEPKDMEPPQHSCSSWQAAPSTIEIPAALRTAADCRGAEATCKGIKTWLAANNVDTGGSC